MHKLAPLPLVLFALMAAGCATGGGNTTTPTYDPTFDYRPPDSTAQAEAGIVMALLSPSYAQGTTARGQEAQQMLSELREGMAADFEEMLIARGFSTKGPFGSYDQMVYADRRDSELILEPRINLQTTAEAATKENMKLMGDNTYSWSNAEVTVGGRLTVNIYEAMTQTKLWTRSIEVPDTTFTFEGQLEYVSPPQRLTMQEPGYRNGMARALEHLYASALKTSWTYLDPAEMKQLRKQAREIRKKAGFDIPR